MIVGTCGKTPLMGVFGIVVDLKYATTKVEKYKWGDIPTSGEYTVFWGEGRRGMRSEQVIKGNVTLSVWFI